MRTAPFERAEFRHPQGTAIAGDQLYVADTEGLVNGSPQTAALAQPSGLTMDGNTIYLRIAKQVPSVVLGLSVVPKFRPLSVRASSSLVM